MLGFFKNVIKTSLRKSRLSKNLTCDIFSSEFKAFDGIKRLTESGLTKTTADLV